MAKKILWIEDDYYHLQGLVSPLKKMNFEIDAVESYDEALVFLKNWRDYDLIILDLLMPNMKETDFREDLKPWHYGRELFYYMKELNVDKPIIIISIVQYRKLIEELLQNGASMHLEKIDLLPIQVKDAVLSLLNKK